MNSKNGKFSFVVILLGAVLTYGIILISGCGSDSTTNNTPTVTDTSIINIDTLTISTSATGNGVNIWKGITTGSLDTKKDIFMATTVGDFLKTDAVNLTYFSLVYPNITNAQFDSLNVIPSSGTIDPETFFTKTETSSYGTLSVPLTSNPVYGFYIKGKSGDGTTGGVKVYGVIYVKSAVSNFTGNIYSIRIKYNKAGLNKFKK